TAAGGEVRYTLYTQAGQLLTEYQPAADEWTDYLYLGSKLVAKVEKGPDLPSGPSSFTATPDDTARSAALAWTADPDADRYIVQESVRGGAWNIVYDGSGLSLARSNLSGGRYDYRLFACIAKGCTDGSVTASTGF